LCEVYKVDYVVALKIQLSESAYGAMTVFPEFITEPRDDTIDTVTNHKYRITC